MYNKLLNSENYVTRRHSLKLLGELLVDRSNVSTMLKCVQPTARRPRATVHCGRMERLCMQGMGSVFRGGVRITRWELVGGSGIHGEDVVGAHRRRGGCLSRLRVY